MTGEMERDADNAGLVTDTEKKQGFCTLGATVNYAISLDFLAIFFCGVIIIGTLGTLQHDLYGSDTYYHNSSNLSSHICILYTTCGPNDSDPCTLLQPNTSRACEGTMALFGLMGALAVVFVVSLVVKALLRHE